MQDRFRHLELGPGEHLEEHVMVVRADEHHVTAAGNDALEQIQADVGPCVDARVPLQAEAHPFNGGEPRDRLDADIL